MPGMAQTPDSTYPTPDSAERRTTGAGPAPGEELSASAAAAVLGVNERTVRRLIHRGVLPARKVGHQYVIDRTEAERVRVARASSPAPGVSRVTGPGQPETDTGPLPPDAGQARSDAWPVVGVDLAPLVGHVAALERRIEHLTEAAAVWQFRALQAEERLKALTAGETETEIERDAHGPRQDAAGAAAGADATAPRPFVAGPPAWRRTPEAHRAPAHRRPWWRRLLGLP